MKNRNYIGEFADWNDVNYNFGGECPAKEPRYVFAGYDTPSYEGYSTVLTSNDGRKFSVVEGSHCSCYGLEGQWCPTEHSRTDIKKMMTATYGFFYQQRASLADWLAHVAR